MRKIGIRKHPDTRGKCRFHRYERHGNSLFQSNYTCDDVRRLKEEWKTEFREHNQTEYLEKAGINDSSYEAFCREIEDFLKTCICGNNFFPDIWAKLRGD